MKIEKITIKAAAEKSVKTSIAEPGLELITSYTVGGSNRDATAIHDIDTNGKLLEFVYDDGTTWFCDANTMHELFPDTDDFKRSGGGTFEIPSTLKTTDGDRSMLGDIALKVLNVFKKKAIPEGIKTVAEKLEQKHLNDEYGKEHTGPNNTEGLYHVGLDFSLNKFTKLTPNKPVLLFIHGTNSSTIGAFGTLKRAKDESSDTDTWNYIHSTYGNNVIAFQHRTLTKSPLQNVIDLVQELPDTDDLHIISHSRGGIIGEILCRYSPDDNGKTAGFSAANIELLKKEKDRGTDVECINTLNKIFLGRKVRVKKFIRVACPAAGTILASKRLDHFLNVGLNLAEAITRIGIATTVKELIGEILETKSDIKVLPGVEAQSPGSPFIKVLNDRSEEVQIDGSQLAVISGNSKAGFSLIGLLSILAKLFYWQRNDMVVNTDSMYLGAARNSNIHYFFDQGSDVSHTTYFANNKTRDAISFALKTPAGQSIPGYSFVGQYSVPASDRALEYGELEPFAGVPSGHRPILVLLPGIMGSNLSRNGDKIWLNYVSALFGGLYDMQHIEDRSIEATSLIKTSYARLAKRLSNTYDVVIYPFDWRQQLNECAAKFNDKIKELLAFNQPIKIIGHSMGGVLVRDFIINHDDTWKQLNHSKGFKLLFLGSPLGGSHRILTVLFGDDAIINSLNFLDRLHTKKELLEMFRGFPGILSLLPLTTNSENDYADINTWKKMREALGESDWPLPAEKELAVFENYRNRIIAGSQQIDYSNMIYIAGKDKQTPAGYFNDTIPPRTELVFLYTEEGDQSVTWASGIPKPIADNNAVYYVDVSHGALANSPVIFNGIEEILETGATIQLSTQKPATRSAGKTFRMPAAYSFDFSEQGIQNAIFGITESKEPITSQVPISVTVSNGDLAYASFHLIAGHFANDGILYAEKAIDDNLSGVLSARHRLGLYPGEIGSNAMISTNGGTCNFKGGIIVGLGEAGNLTPYLLSKTVEQGIAKYLLNINNRSDTQDRIGISSLVVASGYGGLSIENSVKAIIEGINNANTKVIQELKSKAKIVQFIEFIELYEDRALSCMYALSRIESRENKTYNIRIGSKKIKNLFGAKTRLPIDAEEEWWNRITVRYKEPKAGTDDVPYLLFNASTGDAREEERQLFSSTSLIDVFIKQVSTDNNWSACSAKTIFELLIPNEFKDRLKKKGSITWIVDKHTAGYPWELLQDSTANAKPLCVGAGMIRQLSTQDYRINIKRVASNKALVVGDPVLEDFINQLPGAKKEAEAVRDILTANNFENVSLINSTAPEIVLNLFCHDYKMIHLAGHGVFNPKSPSESGMVIGNGKFLTVFDIEQMGVVPELVFVNCCHLGKSSTADEKFFQERYKLAANIGTQLIQIGVKAVIAAGWAVNDSAAEDFARIFYNRMFAGNSFGDAVKEARSEVYEKYKFNNNTWGAYQCYGDPFYRLVTRAWSKPGSIPDYLISKEVEIDLGNLKNSLDTRSAVKKSVIDKLSRIETAKEKTGISSSEITELEADIYFELGEYQLAINKYELLKNSENALFSVKALERYCIARCKKYVEDFNAEKKKSKELAGEINAVIYELKLLNSIRKTTERMTLLASATKRMAFVTSSENDKINYYLEAAAFYEQACYGSGVDKADKPASNYSYNNFIVLQSILCMDYRNTKKLDTAGELSRIKLYLKALKQPSHNMDFWDLNDEACFKLSMLLLDEKLGLQQQSWDDLAHLYTSLWSNAGSVGKKIAELENFIIVYDLLGIVKDKKTIKGKAVTNPEKTAVFFKEKIGILIENLKAKLEN